MKCSLKEKYHRYKRYKKIKKYRKRRDKGEFVGIGSILAYIWYMQDYKNNCLEDLFKLFGKTMVECAFYNGWINVYDEYGFKIHLYDSDAWKKYDKK